MESGEEEQEEGGEEGGEEEQEEGGEEDSSSGFVLIRTKGNKVETSFNFNKIN